MYDSELHASRILYSDYLALYSNMVCIPKQWLHLCCFLFFWGFFYGFNIKLISLICLNYMISKCNPLCSYCFLLQVKIPSVVYSYMLTQIRLLWHNWQYKKEPKNETDKDMQKTFRLIICHPRVIYLCACNYNC